MKESLLLVYCKRENKRMKARSIPQVLFHLLCLARMNADLVGSQTVKAPQPPGNFSLSSTRSQIITLQHFMTIALYERE